ncbi:MAG: cell division protein FtsA [Bacteroidetes bacterium]|nr:cell division protein FtsA [Bacteroidota bacterium]
MNERIIAALDIGTTKVAALAARQNEYGKVEVLGIGLSQSLGVKRGVVANIDKTVQAIKKAVAQAEEQSGIKFKEVMVGIAGQHIKSLQHRGILVRDQVDIEIDCHDIKRLIDDMHKLSLPPGDKIIHVLPQDYIVDNEQGITEPVGMAGIRLEGNFHIITGQTGAIHNINRCVNRAGMEIENIVLEPLASAAAVLSQEELEAGVALVDIGGGTTDIAIFEEGIIRHTSVIPFGGDIITEDIKKGCMILRDQAESLKVKFGSALALETQDNEIVAIPGLRGRNHKEISIRNLSHIIQARMEEILEHVHFELRGADYDKNLIGGIVLTGGGSQLKHLVQLTQLVTGMEARLGIPNEHLAATKLKESTNPIFATGIGLAVRAFNEADAERELAGQGLDSDVVEEVVEAAAEINNLDIDVDEVESEEQIFKAEDGQEEEMEGEPTNKGIGKFFRNILENAKDFLESDMDDFQDNK